MCQRVELRVYQSHLIQFASARSHDLLACVAMAGHASRPVKSMTKTAQADYEAILAIESDVS